MFDTNQISFELLLYGSDTPLVVCAVEVPHCSGLFGFLVIFCRAFKTYPILTNVPEGGKSSRVSYKINNQGARMNFNDSFHRLCIIYVFCIFMLNMQKQIYIFLSSPCLVKVLSFFDVILFEGC